jgi:hypothetical protein
MLTNTAKAVPLDAADSRFGSPLVAGLVDRLGERWTTTDAADSTPLELLRFRAEVSGAPGFEDALRERVTRLASFKDLAFPAIREVVKDGEQLTVVTSRVPGQRLSEVAPRISKAKRVTFVIRMLRDATRALAALEAAGGGITHSALTAERIVLTPDGRVFITEHMLAAALQQLALWPEELWTDFGLLARADEDGEAIFDARTTVMQLAVIALSVLVARQITLQDFEHRLAAILEEITALPSVAASPAAASLRDWLERALQLGPEKYSTAAEAEAGLRKVLAGLSPVGAMEVDTIHLQSRADAGEKREEARPTTAKTESGTPAAVPATGGAPVAAVSTAIAVTPQTETRPWRRPDVHSDSGDEAKPWVEQRPASRRERYLLWAAIALVIVTIGEAIAITRLLMRPPTVVLTDSSITIESPQAGDTVLIDGKTVGSTPLKVRVNPKTQAIRLVAAPPPAPVIDPGAAAAKAESDRAAAALDQAAARQRSGGVAITAPIPMAVFEGDRLLGSTADGPIVASAGRHQLDFVNTALGYRSRQTVTIRAGVIAPLTVTPPMGRISINAQPWAQVLIDDTAVGDTPLANVPVAIGDHQITFRHPQLGERRERVTVRADGPARISTTFAR